MTNSKTKEKNKLIYVIAGKEKPLLNTECEKLLNNILDPEQRATALFNAETDKTSISQVLDELRTLPFLAEKRFVLLKNADKFISNNRQLLEKYFDAPCPTGILIMTVNSWDSRTKLAKKLPSAGKLINVVAPTAGELPGRLTRYAHDAHNKNLNNSAAQLLIELAGANLVQLYREIDKLATFANEQETITAQHIELLIGHNRLFNAFAVIDAVTTGDTVQAVSRLRRMFTQDKATEFTVVGAFAFHFRRMFNAKVLLQKGTSSYEIVKRLRIWSNKENFFSQLRRIPLKQIGDSLCQLASIDYAIKTGQTKPKVAMEQLVYKLTANPDSH